jgi:hypothetical protein
VPIILNTAQAPPPLTHAQQLTMSCFAPAQQQLLCTPPQLAKLHNHVRCEDGKYLFHATPSTFISF